MPNLVSRSVWLTLLWLQSSAFAAPANEAELRSAAQSYNYVEQILQTYGRTGRIATGLGLDGADYAEFLQVLRATQAEFTELFGAGSELCNFYRERSGSIEDDAARARAAVALLPTLAERQSSYLRIDGEFKGSIESLFGRFLLEELNRHKLEQELTFRLPILPWEDLDPLVFAEGACGG